VETNTDSERATGEGDGPFTWTQISYRRRSRWANAQTPSRAIVATMTRCKPSVRLTQQRVDWAISARPPDPPARHWLASSKAWRGRACQSDR